MYILLVKKNGAKKSSRFFDGTWNIEGEAPQKRDIAL